MYCFTDAVFLITIDTLNFQQMFILVLSIHGNVLIYVIIFKMRYLFLSYLSTNYIYCSNSKTYYYNSDINISYNILSNRRIVFDQNCFVFEMIYH